MAYGGWVCGGAVAACTGRQEETGLMKLKRLLGIAIAVCAVATLAGSIGAGAARTPAKHAIDLSSNTGVREYLRSVGISPRGVVIQRGKRNYAGPRCPGKRWTCTASRRVVQIAAGRGANTFSCSTARCVVVQAATAPLVTNTAKCVKTTGITQSCSITQTSTDNNNQAIVYMDAAKASGLTQNASQTAQIVQTAGAGANQACVFQRTTVDGSTVARKGMPVSVNLNAHQTISITQNSASGGNTVQNASSTSGGSCATGALDQRQTITSRAQGTATVTQNQNTIDSGPNMVVDIAQNQRAGFLGSATGANDARFDQTNTLAAIAIGPGPVFQTQSTENGGIEGTINQFSQDPSNIDANQTEIQCVHAQTTPTTAPFIPCPTGGTQPSSLTQVQFGPMRKGDGPSVQGDNPSSTFDVIQSSTQDSDGGSTQTNTIEGDCSTSGNCAVTQTTNIDGTPHTNTESGQNVDTQTTCSGSTCTSSGPTTTGDLTLLPDGLSVANSDVAEFGFGGMRGSGTGSIAVSGVSGPVFHAFLYWNGPTNSTDPNANAAVTFNGMPVTGTNIGVASSNCWGFTNSQSYRADVTSLVTGNGSYSLADFLKPDADINGVALIVFYDDGNSGDDRTVVLWNGNDSNFQQLPDPAGWDETINDVPYQGGTASLDFVVSDGQTADDPQLLINGVELAPVGPNFSGETLGGPFDASGSLWDVKSFNLTPFLTGASTDLNLTTGLDPAGTVDCTSLVVAAANAPVSGPVILAPARQDAQATLAPRAATTGGVPANSARIAGTTAGR
jgi:hypothetical protein